MGWAGLGWAGLGSTINEILFVLTNFIVLSKLLNLSRVFISRLNVY